MKYLKGGIFLFIIFIVYCINNIKTANADHGNILVNQFLIQDDIEAGYKKILEHFRSNGNDLSIFINDTQQTGEIEDEEYKKLSLNLEEILEMIKNRQFKDAFEKLEFNREKAILLKHAAILYHLGESYLYGEGTERDEKKAFENLEVSAMMGYPKAQRELGFLYGTGRGVEKNQPFSLLYYAFAASQGDLQAAMSLGFKYKEGIGVSKNCGKGLLYYKFVASKVIKKIEESMMEEKLKIKRIAKDVRSIVSSGDEIEEDNLELLELYSYNAENGDAKSQIVMANFYLKGTDNVARNFKKAFKYFSMAAKTRASAKGMLGFMYKNGFGIEANNETAYNYFEEGAKANDPYSLVSLGRTYLKGELGQEKDFSKALNYFNEASKKGHALAHYYLGECYASGTGVVQDLNKASQFYQISAPHVVLSSYKLSLVQMMQLNDPLHACEQTISVMKDISEKGQIGKLFHVAHAIFEKEYSSLPSSFPLSSLYYEKLAEMGFEVAQHNSGWIFHNHLHLADRALKYYKWSAVQNNAHSHLQIGNYYYYGYFRDLNGEIISNNQTTPDMKKAFKSYQIAASFNEPESLFNLGWMHQEGLGITKDKHLAKRYYDLSLTYFPSAFWAIKISLFYLNFLNFVETYQNYEMYGYKWDSWLIAFLAMILTTLLLFRKMIQNIQRQNNIINNQQNNNNNNQN